MVFMTEDAPPGLLKRRRRAAFDAPNYARWLNEERFRGRCRTGRDDPRAGFSFGCATTMRARGMLTIVAKTW